MKKYLAFAGAAVLAFASLQGCGNAAWTADSPQSLNLFAGHKGSAPNSADTFRFVVMSDRNAYQELGKWAQAVDEINHLKPDFVMSIGDYVRGYTNDEQELARQWKEFEKEHQFLQAPFFYTPGNHDVFGVEPRRAYELRHAQGGKAFDAFTYRRCRFIVLDTTPWTPAKPNKGRQSVDVKRNEEIIASQWQWLKKELAAANQTSRHVFIFGHHPFWDYPEAWSTIRPMLDASKTSIFAGHTHKLLYTSKDGIPCHNLAVTGSRSVNEPLRGDFQMFSVVTVDAGKPTVAHLKMGSVLPYDYVTRHAVEAMSNVMNTASLTSVQADGGETVLTLWNKSDRDVQYSFQWIGLPSTREVQTLTVPAGQKLTKPIMMDAGMAAARPRLLLESTVSIDGKARALRRELPLVVVGEHRAIRVKSMVLDGDLADFGAAKPTRLGPAELFLGYDDTNLYVGFNVADSQIISESETAWENDGVEIFWDPRPLVEAGKFEGPARQIATSILADGGSLRLEANPADDKEMLSAVKTGCRKTPRGYAVEMAIPLAMLSPALAGAPEGKSIRMDVYVKDKPAAQLPTETSCLSGQGGSSRRTGHYVTIKLEK